MCWWVTSVMDSISKFQRQVKNGKAIGLTKVGRGKCC